jgi:hypothetical protein
MLRSSLEEDVTNAEPAGTRGGSSCKGQGYHGDSHWPNPTGAEAWFTRHPVSMTTLGHYSQVPRRRVIQCLC